MEKNLSRRSLLKGALAGAAGIVGVAGAGCRSGQTAAPELTYTATVPGIAADGTSTPTPPTPSPTATLMPPVTLRDWANKAAIEVGATLGHREVSGMFPLIAREFNTASVSYALNWNNIETSRGTLQFQNLAKFADADGDVRYAIANSMKIHGQALIDHGSYPDWLKNGTFDRDELRNIIRTHVIDVVSHFRGKIARWVVANEFHPLNWTGYTDYVQQSIGADVLDIAFQAARDADPSATLIYNDNANHARKSGNVFDYGAYANTLSIVDRLTRKGILDGVGVQMHLDGSNAPSPDDVSATLKSYGLPVYITEMDVNMKDVAGSQDKRYSQQAEIYKTILQAAIHSGACKSFIFYTVGDRYSWIETDKSYGKYSPNADPTPFDDNLKPKPAYYAILGALQSVAQGG